MRKIQLSQGQVTLVDDEDYEKLAKHSWHVKKGTKTLYAIAWIDGKKIFMHRLLMKTPKGKVTDHIDGDGLNNRRSNLQVCTQSQNLSKKAMQSNNTSGLRGVNWHKAAQKWCVEIWKEGKKHYFGLYTDKEEAARVYNENAKKLFGDFSPV